MKTLIALLVLMVLPFAAQAQTATCVVGPSGGLLTVSLSFVPPTLNTDGTPVATPLTYNLYQSTTPGTEAKVASSLKGTPITVSTGMSPKTTFYFEVSVTDANGVESALSNAVCKTFPASVPGSITITIS